VTVRENEQVDFGNPVDRAHASRIGRAWIEIRRGAWTQNLRIHLFGDDDPLEPGQMDALDVLVRRDRTMKELADRLRIDPSSATRAVQRLVADGLADRYPSPDDGRIVMVKISESGRARHGVVDERRAEAMALILGRFTPDERSELADLLDRFVQAVDDSGDRLARSPMMSRSQPS